MRFATLLAPSNPMWHFFGQNRLNTNLVKNVYILHTLKIVDISKKMIGSAPAPLRLCKGLGFLKMKLRGYFIFIWTVLDLKKQKIVLLVTC